MQGTLDRGEKCGQGRSQKSARTLMVIRILKKKHITLTKCLKKYVKDTQGEAEARQKKKGWNLKRANQIHCSK